jgi:hypothetical protein
MLNGNKENKYRHIPDDMEIVVLFNISIYRKCLLFFVYIVCVMCVCYHLILYYRLIVFEIYVYCKNVEIFCV